MVNRKTVVLNVGGDLAEVPLSSDGHVGCCWLVRPLSRYQSTRLYNVEKITARYVWICVDSHHRRIDRDWLAQSDWIAAVKTSILSPDIRFYGSAVKGGYCAYHAGHALPDDMIGFSEIVGPDSHRRVWEISPGFHANHLFPIDCNSVSLHRRGWPKSKTHIRMSVFDLWLICCGFVDGYEAVYAGE